MDSEQTACHERIQYPRNTKCSNDSEGAYRVEDLLCYVITTCYPKILCHIIHKTLSLPFIKSLSSVTDISFDDSMQHDQPKSTENTNDCILADFMFASPSFRSSIPDIVSQTKLAADKKPFQLYTKSTCQQFHQLHITSASDWLPETSANAVELEHC